MNIKDDGVLKAKWRVGRGGMRRNIFAMVGQLPSVADVFIGMMDEARDAKHIVELHNASLPTKAELTDSQKELLDGLMSTNPAGLRKAAVDLLTAVTEIPGLAHAPDYRLIAELRKQIPPPARCPEDEGATGIQCYRTDAHEVHRGYHPELKVWITWPVSRPYEQLTEQEGGPPNERISG